MRTVRMETSEPFLKRKVTFEGVLLSELLAWRVSRSRPARTT